MNEQQIKAMELALEALNTWCEGFPNFVSDEDRKAINALKEALAHKEPEHCQCAECKVVLHSSDCAVHSEPAYPKGECNCGAHTHGIKE